MSVFMMGVILLSAIFCIVITPKLVKASGLLNTILVVCIVITAVSGGSAAPITGPIVFIDLILIMIKNKFAGLV